MKRNRLILSILIALTLVAIILTFCGNRQNKIEVCAASVKAPTTPPSPEVKIFIENSGSMDGYMCDGSQLKDAVYDYASDINHVAAKTELYYINTATIKFSGNLIDYIKALNPTAFRNAGGNRANTDLGNIMADALRHTDKSAVCILISDCILDLPSHDARNFLENCRIRIKDEIIKAKKRIPDLAVEILRLESDFTGLYYYPNGTSQELSKVRRPYFIWIFGSRNNLAFLNSRVPISQLKKYGLSSTIALTGQSELSFDIFNNSLTGKTVLANSNGDYNIIIT